jgi:very-short-patch-repair endonuclease
MPDLIKLNDRAIQAYYERLRESQDQAALHEGNVRTAFESLLEATARLKSWTLVSEYSDKSATNRIRYDGVLRDQYRLPHGFWEAKDTSDDLTNEIRKKIDKGYSLKNTIFEDTRVGVLFQDGREVARADLRKPDELVALLNRFYSYDMPPFRDFAEAVKHFQSEVPHIALELNERIKKAHKDNRAFQTAYGDFFALCQTALNPNISRDAVDEMLIQHMLTERLITRVFDMENFARRNVIAGEIQNVIDALASQHFNYREFLGALDRFYSAIERAADELATFADKQTFINTIYERFFQGYSVKTADTHGIVYTPQEIVDFMCAAVEEVLLNEFGQRLGDPGVVLIDPCTGTGNFVVNLLRRVDARNLDRFYREQLFANEVMLLPYYIAALNIEHAYYERAGQYAPFEGLCFVDTLDLAEGAQMKLGFMTEKNTERVERQKAAPITVIIGNPPYNVGQLNENDNNKNRKYEVIDKQVSETYARASSATNKNALSDPYVKFFRWASDRLQGRDGVVCYVTNNSFFDQIAFDGMRKHLLQDFTDIYHLDLHGNVRQNPKLSGTTHNVFGIQVGVGITVAVRRREKAANALTSSAITPNALTPVALNANALNANALTPSPSPKGEGSQEASSGSPSPLGEGFRVRADMSAEAIFQARTAESERLAALAQEGGFRQLAAKAMVSIARDLRQRETPSEDMLWEALRNRRLGELKFRRQHPIAKTRYVVDFLCYERDLVVEVDGGVHSAQRAQDAERQAAIAAQGYRVIRFDVVQVREDLQGVLEAILRAAENGKTSAAAPDANALTALTPSPSPKGEGSQDESSGSPSPLGEGFRVRANTPPPPARLLYHRVPELATRKEKLDFLAQHVELRGRENSLNTIEWQELTPDTRGTWLVPENADEYSQHIALGSKDAKEGRGDSSDTLFKVYGRGVATSRDDLAYSFQRTSLIATMRQQIDAYNAEVDRYKRSGKPRDVDNFVQYNIIKWSRDLKLDLQRGKYAELSERKVRFSLYRPFCKRHLFFDRVMNEEIYIFPRIFPTAETEIENQVICAMGLGAEKPFTTSISRNIPDLNFYGGGAVPQWFAFYAYDEDGGNRRENITDWALAQFRAHYADDTITKWDIFYYVYALLHHPGYRERYADNLKRELPRIPFVPKALSALTLNPSPKGEGLSEDSSLLPSPLGDGLGMRATGVMTNSGFWAFADAGRALAKLHLEYESVEPHPLKWIVHKEPISYRVEKMRLSKDKTSLKVNDTLTLDGIPPEVYEYKLGNRSALDWIIDQYQVTTDKRSGITSDPNGYSDDPQYIVRLVERIVTVSLETVRIVRGLAALPFRAEG